MFTNLIKAICTLAGVKPYVLGRELGYKTPSAFQKVISGQDIRLSILLIICNALGYTILIQDGQGRTIINITDYYNRQKETKIEKEND